MNHCCHVSDKSENFRKCYDKTKYGEYCRKHRSHYLLDEAGFIRRDRFTGQSKDYLIKDIRKYCKGQGQIKSNSHATFPKSSLSLKKNELFKLLSHQMTMLNHYDENLTKLIKIQSVFRGNAERHKGYSRKTCNNTEDFFTFELIQDIPDMYFYSYVDTQKFRWGFDIRSLHKLLSMNYPNPYTTESLPESIIQEVHRKIEYLKGTAPYEDIMDIVIRDRKTMIKQRTVDLFSKIEQSGYTCHIEWFTSLSVRRLKELYKQLEDLWNYRAQLTGHMKTLLCPPDGLMFRISVAEIMSHQRKEDLQEIILGEVSKFTHCENDANRKLAYMYFIIGFGYVSHECYVAHCDWLNAIN